MPKILYKQQNGVELLPSRYALKNKVGFPAVKANWLSNEVAEMSLCSRNG